MLMSLILIVKQSLLCTEFRSESFFKSKVLLFFQNNMHSAPYTQHLREQ